MQREIKFRCWDDINKKWLDLYSIKFSHNGKVIAVHTLDGEMYGFHQIKLMQFTGLYDKNGRKIYEGDIIRVNDVYNEREFTGCVDFMDASFMIKNDYSTNYRWQDYKCDVIGNIHENPSLLE